MLHAGARGSPDPGARRPPLCASDRRSLEKGASSAAGTALRSSTSGPPTPPRPSPPTPRPRACVCACSRVCAHAATPAVCQMQPSLLPLPW